VSAADVLAEARAGGVNLYRRGERLRWRAPAPIAPDLAARIREHWEALLVLVPDSPPRNEAREVSGCSDACDGIGLTSTATTEAIAADDWPDPEWLGLRAASRVLGEDVWLVPDDASAENLERELEAEGKSLLVFTLAEVFAMEGMLAADMQAIAKLKRTLTDAGLGGRIRSVTRREGSA
jgi:hypothetical protein